MTTGSRTLLGAVLLAAIACAAHAPVLDVGFFSDDYQWLGRMNATMERPSYVFTVFFRDFNPVLHSSFALDWILGGSSAWVWHADSILLHGLTTALLFLLCLRLGATYPVAVAATLLWSLNVRLSEAVLWPAARGHQLATLCTLAALVWVLGRPRGSRWPALLIVGIGLFAKETALFAIVAIPFFLPEWKRERRFLAGLAGLGAGFVLLNVFIKGDLHTSGAGLGALLLKAPFILLRPLGLGDIYRFDLASLIVVGAAFAGLAWWLRRGSGLAGLIWVLACSAPIVPLDKLSSRYLYLPAVGYAVVFCALCTAIRPHLRSDILRRWVPLGAAAAIVLVLLANTLRIQREIGDYRVLAQPYGELIERFGPAVSTLAPGEVILVVDAAPQTTIRDLTREINERGNMTKLIPYRRHAIDGLIELPDLLNVARPRLPGTLGRPVPEAGDSTIRWFRHDGISVSEVQAQPLDTIPVERVHRAAWGDAARHFAQPL
jgi:hypothetical protein